MASTEEKPNNGKPKQKAKSERKPKCGIVMPISDMEGYPPGHWSEVLTILETVVGDANFEVDLVSNADEVTVIHQTIIQNLYENDIVICDVSGKNSNVMFELGMRLAFDKPTIIIIDDRTEFSFDTGVISHVLYPSDLRFPKMVAFQETLKAKILATHKKSIEDANYSPFLKHFGRYRIARLETKDVSSEDFILKSLSELTNEVRNLRKTSQSILPESPHPIARGELISGGSFSLRKEYTATLGRKVEKIAREIFGKNIESFEVKPSDKNVAFAYLELNHSLIESRYDEMVEKIRAFVYEIEN